MREIRFRAWDKEEKRMCRVISVSPSDDGSAALITVYSNFSKLAVIGDNYPKRFELLQYTGFKANGKEIYEGDIVSFRYYDNSGGNGEVNFKRGAFYVNEAHPFNQLYSHGFEILGNIYENPELLKENA